MGGQLFGFSLLKGQLIWYVMLAVGSLSMNGDRILQLLQSGYQGHLSIGGFPPKAVLPQPQSQLLRKSSFHSSLKLQLGGPTFFASVLFSHPVLFNFIGPSGLLVRMVQHQSGFAQAKDFWVLDLVGSWRLMLS
jgi:hypothetical protein